MKTEIETHHISHLKEGYAEEWIKNYLRRNPEAKLISSTPRARVMFKARFGFCAISFKTPRSPKQSIKYAKLYIIRDGHPSERISWNEHRVQVLKDWERWDAYYRVSRMNDELDRIRSRSYLAQIENEYV